MTTRSTAARPAPLVRGRGKQRLLYRQLADRLRAEIEGGRLKPGAMLPSMDDLATRHRIHKATVRQAITQLSAAGLVYSVPARGTFVAERLPRRDAAASRPLSVGWVLSVNDQGRTGPYHTEIMDAVQAELRSLRAHLLVVNAAGMSTAALCRAVGEAHLDAAVLIGGFAKDTVRHLAGTGLPSVLLDDTCRGAHIDSVVVDNRNGGYQAVRHLAELGHRHLALVTGPSELGVTADRLAGALEAAGEAGIERSRVHVIASDFSPDGGRAAAAKILALRPRPTGIFFFNDEMAAAALQVFHGQAGAGIPEDLSIVGFDDILWASLTNPPLTTVRVEKDLMAREAVERLRRRLASGEHTPTTTIVPTRLIVRKSTSGPHTKRS